MAVFSKFAVSVVAVAVGYEEEHCETASALRMIMKQIVTSANNVGNENFLAGNNVGNEKFASPFEKKDDGFKDHIANVSGSARHLGYKNEITMNPKMIGGENAGQARGKKLDAGSLVTLIRDKKNFKPLAEAVLSKESEILKLDAGSLVTLIRDKKNFKPLAEAVLSKESEILEQFGGRRLGQEAEFAAHVSSLLQKADPKTLGAYCDKFEKQFNLVMEEPENKKCNLDEVLLKMQKKMQQESFCDMSEMKKNLPKGVIKYAEALAEAHRQKENKEVTDVGGYICLGILGLLALVSFCALLLVSIGAAESDDSDY